MRIDPEEARNRDEDCARRSVGLIELVLIHRPECIEIARAATEAGQENPLSVSTIASASSGLLKFAAGYWAKIAGATANASLRPRRGAGRAPPGPKRPTWRSFQRRLPGLTTGIPDREKDHKNDKCDHNELDKRIGSHHAFSCLIRGKGNLP
jgi:hypothetical protein